MKRLLAVLMMVLLLAGCGQTEKPADEVSGDALQDPLVAALAVVARKVYHNLPPKMFRKYKHYSRKFSLRQWNIFHRRP